MSSPRLKSPANGAPPRRPGKAGGVRDINRQERLAALERAAAEAFVVHGIEAARIEDIAGAAGLSKAAFYRYFRNKEALVRHLFAPLAAEVLVAFKAAAERLRLSKGPADLLGIWAPLAQMVLVRAEKSPILLRVYLAERRAPPTGARRPLAWLARWIEAGALYLTMESKDRGWLRAHPFVGPLSTFAVIGATEELLRRGLNGEVDMAPAEVVGQLAAMVYGGLLQGASSRRGEGTKGT